VSEINESMVPIVNESILSRKNADGKLALMSLEDDENFFKIEGLAIQVWENIDGKCNIKAIVEKVSDTYNLPKKKLEEDTFKFIDDLYKEGIIKFN